MKLRIPRPKQDPAAEAEPDLFSDATWLYSYADLITQLLLFVILTVTLSGLQGIDMSAVASEEAPKEHAVSEAARELDKYVQSSGLTDSMAIDRSADRLVIRLKSLLLFDEGRATLTPKATDLLAAVSKLLGRLDNAVRVEGHTDDVPIHTAQFPSNWELSTARAISVVRALEALSLQKQRLSAAGYGEFRPIVTNDSETNRAMNRRVEIVILENES